MHFIKGRHRDVHADRSQLDRPWRFLPRGRMHDLTPFVLVVLVGLVGCSKEPPPPPPDSALLVMQDVRDGYNNQNADRFCRDFSDIMFTQGFTKQAYLDVIQGLHKQHGSWNSESYQGTNRGAHVWAVAFEKGKAKLVLSLNDQGKVTGLWFR